MEPPATSPRLVLASASPRRAEILASLGLTFVARPAHLDETPRPGEAAEALAERLARAKAVAAVADGELALGADTVVVVDGELLGKPADAADAAAMLSRLAGREHEVITGIALARVGEVATAVERTAVTFRPMTPEEIAWYVATGEPMDKAGAYAVQGWGGLFVTAIAGSYTNVVGLPVATLEALFRRIGLDLRHLVTRPATARP